MQEHSLDGDEQDRRAACGLEPRQQSPDVGRGNEACTATMPGSASGRMLGDREPGTIRQISSSALSGAFSMR